MHRPQLSYGPTELELIETKRQVHVTAAIEHELKDGQEKGNSISECIEQAANAAIRAADTYPGNGYWPFNRDINDPPHGAHADIIAAFKHLDAGLFGSDTFFSPDAHLFFAAYVARWSQELRERRENDEINRADQGDDG